MFIGSEDPEGPHFFRSAMFFGRRRVFSTAPFLLRCVVPLLLEHGTPKGVPRFNRSKSINITLLRSENVLVQKSSTTTLKRLRSD